MNTNYSLLFYLKKPKNYQGGTKPIYMRMTVNGIQKEVSTGRECEPSRWNSKANRASGTKESIRMLNSYLDNMERQVEDAHTLLSKEKLPITVDTLRRKYLGEDLEKPVMLLEVFGEHNAQIEALLGKGYTKGTLTCFETSVKHLTAFLLNKYHTTDREVKRIDFKFISDYEFFLLSEKSCSGITTAKYMKHLRKIIKRCIAHQYIIADPFAFYKNTAKPKEREFLSKDELERIVNKKFTIRRIEQIRDIFVFCCYTGLSYVDVQKLRNEDIGKGIDGKRWIFTNRQKTSTKSRIPLLPTALDILEKYANHSVCQIKGLVLPVLSNQKMNSYLKEIADLCGINTVLTFHIARHTFATTVTLSNDVPIETVSKMLGHTSLKTTQHYAKILDIKVSKDMQALQQKLGGAYAFQNLDDYES